VGVPVGVESIVQFSYCVKYCTVYSDLKALSAS